MSIIKSMEESIYFKDSKENSIGSILLSSNSNLSSPIAIIAHGFGSHKNGSGRKVANLLAEVNVNSLRFDFYGHGESEGAFEDITISIGIDDILSALDFLIKKGYTNIHLIGTSFGGACSIIAASKTNNLRSLILRSSVTDFWTRDLMKKTKEELLNWKKDGFRIYKNSDGLELKLNYSFLNDMMQLDGFKEAQKIIIPTLIIHGDQDESVPFILSEMLNKVMVNSRLVIIEGADHRYSNHNKDKEALDLIVEELSKYSE